MDEIKRLKAEIASLQEQLTQALSNSDSQVQDLQARIAQLQKDHASAMEAL